MEERRLTAAQRSVIDKLARAPFQGVRYRLLPDGTADVLRAHNGEVRRFRVARDGGLTTIDSQQRSWWYPPLVLVAAVGILAFCGVAVFAGAKYRDTASLPGWAGTLALSGFFTFVTAYAVLASTDNPDRYTDRSKEWLETGVNYD